MPDAPTSTLGRRVGNDSIPHRIAAYVRDQARIAAEASAGQSGRHVEALNNFAECVATRGLDDQRLYALYRISAHAFGDSDAFTPGETQNRLLALLGTDGVAPLPDATLDELVAAAVDDLLDHFLGEVGRLHRQRDEAQEKVEQLEEVAAEGVSDAAEVQQLREELAASRSASEALTEQIEHLRAMVGGRNGKPKKPRRTSLKDEGYPGVYYKDTPDGKVYEIGWIEDGRQRWKTIGPDLEEAVAARAAVSQPEGVAA